MIFFAVRAHIISWIIIVRNFNFTHQISHYKIGSREDTFWGRLSFGTLLYPWKGVRTWPDNADFDIARFARTALIIRYMGSCSRTICWIWSTGFLLMCPRQLPFVLSRSIFFVQGKAGRNEVWRIHDFTFQYDRSDAVFNGSYLDGMYKRLL